MFSLGQLLLMDLHVHVVIVLQIWRASPMQFINGVMLKISTPIESYIWMQICIYASLVLNLKPNMHLCIHDTSSINYNWYI